MSAIIKRISDELLATSWSAQSGFQQTTTAVELSEVQRHLGELERHYAALLSASKEAIQAMDIARDAIQPLTMAQLKLHHLNPQTDKILDTAAFQLIDCIKALE